MPGVGARDEMMLFLKLVVIVAMWIGTAMLSDKMGINALVAPGMVLFGGISFFLGPYATGSGFFVRGGFYVNSATPEWIWRIFGINIWVAAGVTMLYMWKHQGA
jgi:hypothetical protein